MYLWDQFTGSNSQAKDPQVPLRDREQGRQRLATQVPGLWVWKVWNNVNTLFPILFGVFGTSGLVLAWEFGPLSAPTMKGEMDPEQLEKIAVFLREGLPVKGNRQMYSGTKGK